MAEENKVTRLYDLPRDSDVKIFAECSDGSKFLIFHHIDGMYSYCKTEKGGVIHIRATTPLVEVEGGYKIAPEVTDELVVDDPVE